VSWNRPNLLPSSLMLVGLLLASLPACGSSPAPEEVASGGAAAARAGLGGGGGGAGGSGAVSPTCPVDDDASVGNGVFDASNDAGLGIGTLNPSTPPPGGTAFSGDANVSASVDAGSPCH